MEEAEKDLPARTRVRKLLIEPLEAMGLRRKRNVRAEDHAKAVERLVEALAYMSPDGLAALRSVVERLADGPLRNEWPPELVVKRFAWGIEQPPPRTDRLVTSYMRSAAGKRAWEECPFLASELVRYLLRWRRPPLDPAWDGMRARAAERRRDFGAAERREEEGRDSEADRQVLAEWRGVRERVRALVFDRGESSDDEAVSDAA